MIDINLGGRNFRSSVILMLLPKLVTSVGINLNCSNFVDAGLLLGVQFLVSRIPELFWSTHIVCTNLISLGLVYNRKGASSSRASSRTRSSTRGSDSGEGAHQLLQYFFLVNVVHRSCRKLVMNTNLTSILLTSAKLSQTSPSNIY